MKKNHNLLKKVNVIIIFVVTMFVVGGCGENDIKTEEQIQVDILSKDEVFKEYEKLEIDEFELENRWTSVENKSDEVECTLKASDGKDINYEVSYDIEYELKDNEWKIVSFQKSNSSINGIKADVLEQLDIDKIIQEDYMPYTCSEYKLVKSEMDLQSKKEVLYYEIKEKYRYREICSELKLYFEYDNSEGWIYKGYDSKYLGSIVHNNLVGTWRPDNEVDTEFAADCRTFIIITKVENNEVYFEASKDYSDGSEESPVSGILNEGNGYSAVVFGEELTIDSLDIGYGQGALCLQ